MKTGTTAFRVCVSLLVFSAINTLIGCSNGSNSTYYNHNKSDNIQPTTTPTPPTPTPQTPAPQVQAPPATKTVNYEAEIKRTAHGIPHITANDWGSLGYGYGYTYAQDALCLLAKEIVAARGESALYFGGENNLQSDFVMQLLNKDAVIQHDWLDAQPTYLIELLSGYVNGYNRYLDEKGVANLPEGPDGCRNAQWIKPISLLDAAKYFRKLVLKGSSDVGLLQEAMVSAAPKKAVATVATAQLFGSSLPSTTTESKAAKTLLSTQIANAFDHAQLIDVAATGSNAYAFGKDDTENGRGMVLGNPHFPWTGSGNRWYQVHLTIPGVYNVFGASLVGIPLVNIGFNEYVAWSHTVSAANRFTLYELKLNPENPLQYSYDGMYRDITSEKVTALIKLDNGAVESREHTFYASHYGPIIDLGGLNKLIAGWPNIAGTVFSLKDANIDNNRSFAQWAKMGQAKSIYEFVGALKTIGIPWVNTIAADRDGNAYYGDISVIPHVTQNQVDTCVKGLIAPLLKKESHNQVIALDGSTSACEWGDSVDTPEGSNVFGYSELAKIFRFDYVGNSNDSYWLSNPLAPISGKSEIYGAVGWENQQQFFRTRLNHDMVAKRIAGTDGLDSGLDNTSQKVSLSTLQTMMYLNRNYGAEILLDDILEICAAENKNVQLEEATINVQQTCEVLTHWDRMNNSDSVGTHIFTEFWKFILHHFDEDYVVNNDSLWAVPFDATDPLNTPRGINKTDTEIRQLIMKALATATLNLANAHVALTQTWGETQFVTKNGENIPIHGGMDEMGSFSVITSDLIDGGYHAINHGNSYIQAVTWDDSDCPIAQGILTYSQNIDPESPYYADQTKMYSNKEWADYYFCQVDIDANLIAPAERLIGSGVIPE